MGFRGRFKPWVKVPWSRNGALAALVVALLTAHSVEAVPCATSTSSATGDYQFHPRSSSWAARRESVTAVPITQQGKRGTCRSQPLFSNPPFSNPRSCARKFFRSVGCIGTAAPREKHSLCSSLRFVARTALASFTSGFQAWLPCGVCSSWCF